MFHVLSSRAIWRRTPSSGAHAWQGFHPVPSKATTTSPMAVARTLPDARSAPTRPAISLTINARPFAQACAQQAAPASHSARTHHLNKSFLSHRQGTSHSLEHAKRSHARLVSTLLPEQQRASHAGFIKPRSELQPALQTAASASIDSTTTVQTARRAQKATSRVQKAPHSLPYSFLATAGVHQIAPEMSTSVTHNPTGA